MKRDIKKDKYIVSKDYQLIGARYQLSTIEQKLVLSIISLIQPTDTDFMHYQIPLNNFDNLIENNNHLRLNAPADLFGQSAGVIRTVLK